MFEITYEYICDLLKFIKNSVSKSTKNNRRAKWKILLIELKSPFEDFVRQIKISLQVYESGYKNAINNDEKN